jgi:hypothetical protein
MKQFWALFDVCGKIAANILAGVIAVAATIGACHDVAVLPFAVFFWFAFLFLLRILWGPR